MKRKGLSSVKYNINVNDNDRISDSVISLTFM